MNHLKIKETYLIFVIVIGLVCLSLYSTYALFTANTEITDVVSFSTSLTTDSSILEYEMVTIPAKETKVIELNATNSHTGTIYYGAWYKALTSSSDLAIGIYAEENSTPASGSIAAGSSKTILIGITNNGTSEAIVNVGVVGSETSNLNLSDSRTLITGEWSESISPEQTLTKLGLTSLVKSDKLTTFTTTSKLDGTTGIYAAEDDLGTSYYFRGNITNNYVKFANFYWRIVRINGDGSIRMIYDGTQAYANNSTTKDNIVGTSAYNTNYGDNAFVGYMNGTTDGTNFPSGGTNSTSYDEAHANTTNSTIKTYVDNWYKTNIVDKGYSGSVVDAIYCNDRTRVTDETFNTMMGLTGEGFGTYVTAYSLYNRMSLSAEGMPESFTPTLICNQENDKFTVNEDLGNGDLTYPVGLLTVDEMVYGGLFLHLGDASITNDESYLFEAGNYYWTMSPVVFSSGFGDGYASVIIGNDGAFGYSGFDLNNSGIGVRPVITLSSSAITGGTGTSTDPFRLTSEV